MEKYNADIKTAKEILAAAVVAADRRRRDRGEKAYGNAESRRIFAAEQTSAIVAELAARRAARDAYVQRHPVPPAAGVELPFHSAGPGARWVFGHEADMSTVTVLHVGLSTGPMDMGHSDWRRLSVEKTVLEQAEEEGLNALYFVSYRSLPASAYADYRWRPRFAMLRGADGWHRHTAEWRKEPSAA